MLIFNNKVDLDKHLQKIASQNATLGFVPTMGALHQGHLSLLKTALENNDQALISIFVNPTQFNNPEDLKKYPRNLEADLDKIRSVSEKVMVYAPTVEDIYEGQTRAQHYDFDGLENQMEGKFRPGHFDGVGTVVKRFFQIIKPTRAYFGEKDFQQLQIVKKLVEKEKLGVKIIGCPIHREANGLAMSSRNERLTDDQRKRAAIIYQTLKEAKRRFGTESAKKVSDFVVKAFQGIKDFDLEYFEIADAATLLPCKHKSGAKKYRAFIAVFVNKIRLIDTISLN